MQPRILITNGGAHPPEKHADVTAWKIVDLIRVPETPVDPALPQEDRLAIESNREAMRQLKALIEPQIAAVLLKHHMAVQDGERGKLKNHGGDDRVTHNCDVADHVEVEAILAEVNPLFAGTAVAGHFAKPEVQERLSEIIDHDFGHVMKIERCLHGDGVKHPASTKA